jgi:glyoxylase-like metal-dependent hydrolase (beta-lactamase superfamily II)
MPSADIAAPQPLGMLADHPLRDDPVSSAAVNRIPVGNRTLVALSDGFLMMDRDFLGTPEEPTLAHDVLAPRYGEVRLPLGCFLLPGERTVLIDTGYGPGSFRDLGRLVGGNLLPQLAAQDVRPEDIDVLALSHLHRDHSGTVGYLESGEPVFPNARTYIGRGDWEFFVEQQLAPIPIPEHTRIALLELDRRGLVELMDDDLDVAPGVRRLAAPGHTPGHSIYVIHDAGDRVMLFGDALYCPQQLDNLEWSVTFDVDPALARRTRQRFERDLELHGGGALGCHFPGLLLGRALSSRQ